MSVPPEPGAAYPLVTVRILQLPLALYELTRQHNDELLREFALLTIDRQEAEATGQEPVAVPKRLLALVDELSTQYAGITAEVSAQRDAAIAAGESETDLVYRVPPQAAAAGERLGQLLDEADEFCRAGTHLLTLATPPEVVRFRRWYLGEFSAQIGGRDPTPWPSFVDAVEGSPAR